MNFLGNNMGCEFLWALWACGHGGRSIVLSAAQVCEVLDSTASFSSVEVSIESCVPALLNLNLQKLLICSDMFYFILGRKTWYKLMFVSFFNVTSVIKLKKNP